VRPHTWVPTSVQPHTFVPTAASLFCIYTCAASHFCPYTCAASHFVPRHVGPLTSAAHPAVACACPGQVFSENCAIIVLNTLILSASSRGVPSPMPIPAQLWTDVPPSGEAAMPEGVVQRRKSSSRETGRETVWDRGERNEQKRITELARSSTQH